MNDSKRRINETVKNIIEVTNEHAFNGTIKEGFKRRFTIINESDFEKYVPESCKESFQKEFDRVATCIEDGRIADGKQPYNNYLIINLDEPYTDQIIEIMKRHGHWG